MRQIDIHAALKGLISLRGGFFGVFLLGVWGGKGFRNSNAQAERRKGFHGTKMPV